MMSEDDIFKALRAFILGVVPQGVRVLRTPVNRAAMPTTAWLAMSPGRFMPLSTNSSTTDGTSRTVRQPQQFECQIDAYGDKNNSALALANSVVILFRDPYGADALAASGIEIAPLYADDAEQMPLVDGEDQFEERWTFKLVLQVNQVVSTAQQSATIATVDLVNVDSTYPPT